MAQKSFLTQADGWHKEITHREEKEIVAIKMADYAKDGDVIGVGSGSTSYLALCALAKSGKKIIPIPTSIELELACVALGLPIGNLLSHQPDWGFDGADEIDPKGDMIKGRGGAMAREKIVMSAIKGKIFILIDDSKKVEALGQRFSIPIEIHKDSLLVIEKMLYSLGARKVSLRMATEKDGPIITENGFLILDVFFNQITETLNQKIDSLPGVFSTGLFMGFNPEVVTKDSKIYRS